MDTGMMLEFLIPGMQDAEETDFCAEMLLVAADLDQRLGRTFSRPVRARNSLHQELIEPRNLLEQHMFHRFLPPISMRLVR